MTEERKKELMEETAKNIFEDAFKDLPYLRQRMNMLIDTVAAEAREEGIDEMRDGVIETVINAFHPPNQPLIDMIHEGAERLKEKGK